MAFKRGFGNRSFYTRGQPSTTEIPADYAPRVDKNPFYRTMDIFNGLFKKRLKLEAGKSNATDLKTIWVNFGESQFQPIVERIGDGKSPDHSVYRLECTHEWQGKAGHLTDGSKKGPCWSCGTKQSYLGFEHEWQHIIFKSDLVARALFVDQYALSLAATATHVPTEEIKVFLSLLINAFDDLRCNSLWEKVYPGSAGEIWKRWKRLTELQGDSVNKNFLSYVFAVAFQVPTDPKGEFEALRPVVEWGVQKVKYRGFMNMLVDVRVVLDRCMGALLAKVPPQPQQAQDPQQAQQQASQDPQKYDLHGKKDAGANASKGNDPGDQDSGDQDSGDQDSGDQDSGDTDSANGGTDGEDKEAKIPPNIPSVATVGATPEEIGDVLKQLMKGASPLDSKEDHTEASTEDLNSAAISQATRAVLARALGADISDLTTFDQGMPTGEPDQDMQQAIDTLQDGQCQKSYSSQLTSNAKANILLIKVDPEGVKQGAIELSEEDRFEVARLRSVFFRSLGRQKAKRSSTGSVIDVPALIQYRVDHQDSDVFESDSVQQGFAYSILCDMSGSMSGSFPEVCRGVEMLKKSLDFPFVVGNLWGFRGGGSISGRRHHEAEVWMYQYDKKCKGYVGDTKLVGSNSSSRVPVACGGLTPMHSAINVAVTHLWKKMPPGMVKRLFILTDGSPCHVKVTGQGLPEHLLRHYVSKEISQARQHGIQVYTIVIGGNSIEDDQCIQMFGPRVFWKKVDNKNDNTVGKVLSKLVRDNFTRYLKTRAT